MDKTELLDIVEIVGKTVLSSIPIGGALITSVYDVVKGNSLSKRQALWQSNLEKRLSKLEITLDELGKNDLFATALVKATESAMKTARKEKLEYLANAVVNATKYNVEEERLIIFLDLLDKYTVSHIKIINYFYEPTRFEGVSANSYLMGSPTTPLFFVYPELNNDLFNKVYKDLYADGIVNTENLNCTMSGSGMVAKRTTTLGDQFLQFVLESSN